MDPLDPLGLFTSRTTSANIPRLRGFREDLARLKTGLAEVQQEVAATAMAVVKTGARDAWERRATDLFTAVKALETAVLEVGRVEADLISLEWAFRP